MKLVFFCGKKGILCGLSCLKKWKCEKKQGDLWKICIELYKQYTQIKQIDFLLKKGLTLHYRGDNIVLADAVKNKRKQKRTMIIKQ